MKPMVSIIVPIYNASKTLARCVDSILNQEYTDFELLLMDDGSKDESPIICDEYAAKDTRSIKKTAECLRPEIWRLIWLKENTYSF